MDRMIGLDAIRARNEEAKRWHAHSQCEDTFYSCPKSPNYAGNESRETCLCHYEDEEQAIADIDALLAEVERMNEMVPGRWWRVNKPDGSLWCETSDPDEARAASAETGWPLERLFVSQRSEWRAAQ